ncbi:DUF3466 family protein [Kribbella sp. NBC_01505]|uniref:hypothetical protein n=1 Tax=Kribbella sp. NBC_01505 TaxID=2903580 RepID=UPI00386EC061
MRKVTAGFAVLTLVPAVLVSALPATAAPAAACAELPPLPPLVAGEEAGVVAADPYGRYQVGYSNRQDGGSAVVLWRDGAPLKLTEYSSSETGYYAHDVNARAEVVGNHQERAWRVRDGRLTTLANPAGYEASYANANNTAGQVVGFAAVFGEGHRDRAIAWSANGTVRVLPQPAGFINSFATDIDGDGTIVGSAKKYNEEGDPVAVATVVWPATGGYKVLPATDGEVVAIRNGVAVGSDTRADGVPQPVRWDLRTGRKTVLPYEYSRALDVNARGDITIRVSPPDGDSGTLFLAAGQPARAAGNFLSRGLSDTRKVYHQDRTVQDCN